MSCVPFGNAVEVPAKLPLRLTPGKSPNAETKSAVWQTSVGIVLHRNHPTAIGRTECAAIASDPAIFPSQERLDWLRLIFHTEAMEGTALWVERYVQLEILLE